MDTSRSVISRYSGHIPILEVVSIFEQSVVCKEFLYVFYMKSHEGELKHRLTAQTWFHGHREDEASST